MRLSGRSCYSSILSDASHVLSSVLSSLIRLCLASIGSGVGRLNQPALSVQGNVSLHPINLTARLCRAITPAAGQQGLDIAESALRRAANVAARLRSVSAASDMDEYGELVDALECRDVPLQGISDGSSSASIANGQDPSSANLLHLLNPQSANEQNPIQFPPLAPLLAPTTMTEETGAELFWDPSFSWPNLDVWLSALDGSTGNKLVLSETVNGEHVVM